MLFGVGSDFLLRSIRPRVCCPITNQAASLNTAFVYSVLTVAEGKKAALSN